MMDRRVFVTASAVALTGAGAMQVLPKTADPHPVLFREWVTVRDRINGTSLDEDDPLWARLYELEHALIETPVTTVAGLLASLKFAVAEGFDLGEPDGNRTTDRCFTDSLIANVEALEGEFAV